jgi:sec-independent protein translocase protein TatA
VISPPEIALFAGLAVLLFGAERLPKIARSAGQMRREFLQGQSEAENPRIVPTVETHETPVSAEVKDHETHSAS